MAMRSGEPIPDRIVNKPKLNLGSEIYFQAYIDLSPDITWLSVVKYGQFYELDKDTIENLIHVLKIVHYDFNQAVKKKDE